MASCGFDKLGCATSKIKILLDTNPSTGSKQSRDFNDDKQFQKNFGTRHSTAVNTPNSHPVSLGSLFTMYELFFRPATQMLKSLFYTDTIARFLATYYRPTPIQTQTYCFETQSPRTIKGLREIKPMKRSSNVIN
jgi:hypothetical protein